jgi:hypothetical protein
MASDILACCSSASPATSSVMMLPGSTALTVMRLGARSIAAVRLKPSWPALVAP